MCVLMMSPLGTRLNKNQTDTVPERNKWVLHKVWLMTDIGEKIIVYNNETSSPAQVPWHTVMYGLAEHDIEIDKEVLEEFIPNTFEIPTYQRGYEWEREQWGELLAEIEELFSADISGRQKNIEDVFFGSIFVAKQTEGDETYFEVIDGQQRLTTLAIIFKIISEKLTELRSESDDDGLSDQISSEVTNTKNIIFKDTGLAGSNELSLKLDERNNDFFEALIRGESERISYIKSQEKVHGNTKYGAIDVDDYLDDLGIDSSDYEDDDDLINILEHTKSFSESNKQILGAYEYFNRNLESLIDGFSTEETLFAVVNVREYLLKAFRVGYFKVDAGRPRLLMDIFEILNNRGMELKKTDVINTKVVRRFQETDYEHCIDLWDDIVELFGDSHSDVMDFLTTYFVVKEDGVRERGDVSDHVLEAFVLEEYRAGPDAELDSRFTESDEEAKIFIEELAEMARYYSHIVNPYDEGLHLEEDEIEEKCNRILTRLDQIGTSVWQPFLLRAYQEAKKEDVNQDSKLYEYLEIIESLTIRFSTGVDVNVKNETYADAIEEFDDEPFSDDVKETLIETPKSEAKDLFGDRFLNRMVELNWTSDKNAKQLLRKIASDKFIEEGKDASVIQRLNVDDNIVHLEHILPKSPLLSSGSSDKYEWFKSFFKTDEDTEIGDLVESLIDEGYDDELESLAEDYYIYDLANMILLQYETNLSIGNKPFGEKLIKYSLTDQFGEIEPNKFIDSEFMEQPWLKDLVWRATLQAELDSLDEDWADVASELDIDADSKSELEEKIESEISTISEESSDYNSKWNYEVLAENKNQITRLALKSIELEHGIDTDGEGGEFDLDSLDEEIEAEMERRKDVILANYNKYIDS